jgi:ABC-type polysaccharide/polyol phosphate transport system ATPase subunit
VSIAPGAIRLRGVSRRYKLYLEHNKTLKETMLRRRRTRSRELWALRDVDLTVEPGTSLGVVGANGAGKSTLLKVLAGIIPPNGGTVEVGGKVASLLELGAGFHQDFSGRENVILNASIHGMTRREIERRMDSIIEFSELGNFIDASVRTYSTGMLARLGFAVSSALQPDVMLLDEILAVGDAAFQQKCMARIVEFQRGGGTIVFVSHASSAVEAICTRAIWLSGGHLLAEGNAHDVIAQYHEAILGDAESGGMIAARAVDNADWRSARIREVRLTDGERPCTRFISGERLVVEVDYEVVEPVSPVVKLTFTTAEGALIAGTDNTLATEAPGLQPGLRTARFTVESLPLQGGRFALGAALDAAAGDWTFHHLVRCAEFTVFSSQRGYGPVALSGGWEIAVGASA